MKNKDKKFDLYKTIQSLAILGLFVTLGIIVLGFCAVIKLTTPITATCAIVAVICGSGFLAMPWVRRLQNNQFKILSYIFLGLVGVCCILWVISVIQIVKIVNFTTDAVNGTEVEIAKFTSALNFLKVVLVISIQFITASTIANTIVKYRKNLIPFQAIMYLSHAFVDFYITYFLCCLVIAENKIDISSNVSLLGNKFMWVTLVLALLYVGISGAVIKRTEERRLKDRFEDEDLGVKQEPAKANNPTEEKLNELKALYDKQILTKEEYEAKRAEIISNM